MEVHVELPLRGGEAGRPFGPRMGEGEEPDFWVLGESWMNFSVLQGELASRVPGGGVDLFPQGHWEEAGMCGVAVLLLRPCERESWSLKTDPDLGWRGADL